MSWLYKTAIAQRAALACGEISAIELLDATIAHLENLSPYLNPIALPLYEHARKAALVADKKLARGKGGALCGIPITIKDSQWLAGVPCMNGSVTLKEFIPQETSLSVQRLQAAGGIIFAKTTCPEFCLSGITDSAIYGRTSNPWNVAKTPGGSSGGAASAVAAGIGSLAFGSDGGGSIRIPAAFCGITGFKPSHGIVPRDPGFQTWQSIVSYGPMARSVADARLMFSVLTETNGTPTKRPSRLSAGLSSPEDRLALIASEDLGFAPVDTDVRNAFRAALLKIENTGNKIKYDNPGLTSSSATWVTIATYDMWKHKGTTKSSTNSSTAQSSTSGDDMGEHAREFIKLGGTFTAEDHEDAQIQKMKIHDVYMEMFRRNRRNLLITPTLGCAAFQHDTTHPAIIESKPITYPWLDWAGFLYDANLTGMPACSIPMGINDAGLPLGLQIIGPPNHDFEVLQAAHIIEQILEWQQPEFGVENYASTPNRVHTEVQHQSFAHATTVV